MHSAHLRCSTDYPAMRVLTNTHYSCHCNRSAPSSSTSPSPCSTASTPSAALASRNGSPGRNPPVFEIDHPAPPPPRASPARHAGRPCAKRGPTPPSPRCWTCSCRRVPRGRGPRRRRRRSRRSINLVIRCCRRRGGGGGGGMRTGEKVSRSLMMTTMMMTKMRRIAGCWRR